MHKFFAEKMFLLLDIGNTYIKAAVSDGSKIIEFEEFTTDLELEAKKKWFDKKFSKVLVTCVNFQNFNKLKPFLSSFQVELISHQTPIPITNNYENPQTLGIDRLMNAVAASGIFPQKNVLIIDAGTAIKFDYLDQEGKYLGGAISPGIKLRLMALHQFTDQLPKIKMEEIRSQKNYKMIGVNTKSAMLSGVINGCLHEIEARVSSVNDFFENYEIILTGGDAVFFAEKMKNPIFVRPNLPLYGLQEILNYRKNI